MSPTAKQLVVLGHETPNRLVSVAPFGVGLGTIFQLVPSHRSINVLASTDVDARTETSPTAKQLVGLEQATASSSGSLSTASDTGLGLGTIDQPEPSHRWINVPCAPPPTAKQLVGVAHATPARSPTGGPAGLGLGETDQRNAAPDGDAPIATAPPIRASTARSRTDRELCRPLDRTIGRIKPHSPANDPRTAHTVKPYVTCGKRLGVFGQGPVKRAVLFAREA